MHRPDEMERIREAIRRAMTRKGIKAKPLAKAAGLGETAVRDILEPSSTDIKFSTLNKLADALECSLEDLMGVDEVPLTGRIGAGGTIIFEDAGTDQTVMRPPNIGGKLEALEVAGDSMMPKFSDGDVIYIQRTHDGVLPAYIGEYCAVRLVTGETYLKLLAKGSRPGRFTLRSLNAADIEDVEVEWATPVVFILPRFARQRLTAI
ncbi:repressor LexA [Sphingomonas laterariae]|uniref:Repressor LexA n=1 Tax=Edaphosphingomonas laterariae TaxID=861865 RepID=A0A239FBR5_9SPHN|nr:S24 family peptidase [Sphingomonas laterariae]SNS53753.1 repressor LexA [Sphingomonas laterariae]